MNNPSDPIENLTRDLPTCTALPRPTASLRTLGYQTLLGTNYRRMKSFQIALPLKINLLDIYKKCNLIYLALILNTGNMSRHTENLSFLKN